MNPVLLQLILKASYLTNAYTASYSSISNVCISSSYRFFWQADSVFNESGFFGVIFLVLCQIFVRYFSVTNSFSNIRVTKKEFLNTKAV